MKTASTVVCFSLVMLRQLLGQKYRIDRVRFNWFGVLSDEPDSEKEARRDCSGGK